MEVNGEHRYLLLSLVLGVLAFIFLNIREFSCLGYRISLNTFIQN